MPDPLWDQLMAQGQTPPSLWPDAAPVDPNYQRDPFEVAAQRVRQPYRNIAAPGSSNLGPIAEALAPTEPWEYGLMVAGPGPGLIGRGLAALPAAARLGAAAAGFALTPSEAEAGGKRALLEKVTGFAPFANPKLRSKADEILGRYSNYAEEYPPIGPPALRAKTPDPKSPGDFLTKPLKGEIPYATMEEALAKDAEPGFFLEKKLTPEVEKFQKDRSVVQQDMDVHGYAPYFDPEKRFDVNPKNYGPFKDTAVEAAPKTEKTDAEWYAKYGSPEARARLQEGYAKGQTVPGSENWYFMGQLEKAYTDELGAKAGREAFKREFGDMMSATTGGAAPYDNFLMSQYANVMAKKAERMPGRAYNLPFPIGGRYAGGNIAQAQKYIDEGMAGFNPEVNPKRYDFSSAFQGNKNAATIDEQMMNAIEPGTNIPQWYGPATRVAREEAGKAGMDPRGFQDIGWAGLKSNKVEAKGQTFDYEGPMINHINRSIETTSRLTGMPREEVVRRGLIKKEIPMYGLGGAALAPALFGGGDEQPAPDMWRR